MNNFTCPRTCPFFERRDICRFMPVLSAIGPTVVTSHTARVKAEFKDADRLAGAVAAMGGEWLGAGEHRLYSESVTGMGFTLPGWRYPIVRQASGELAYDNYGGKWGNAAMLDTLKAEYVLGTAYQAATALGWSVERSGDSLTIHHPSGGHMVIGPNEAEAFGFQGVGCHDALMSLGVNLTDLQAKPEFAAVAAAVQIPS